MNTNNQPPTLVGSSDLSEHVTNCGLDHAVTILHRLHDQKELISLIENLNLLEEQYLLQEHPFYKLITKTITTDVQQWCKELLDERYGKHTDHTIRTGYTKRSNAYRRA